MLSRQFMTIVTFGAIGLAVGVLPLNIVTPLTYIGLNVIVCTGLVMMAGIAGITSFGQAAFVGLGAYTTASLTTWFDLSPWVTLPASLGAAAIVGWLLGALTIRMSGHYLVLSTIASGLSLYYLFGTIPALGGFNGISNLPAISLFGYPLDGQRAFASLLWPLLGLILAGLSHLLDSRIGRAMRSLRASAMAESVGVDTGQLKMQIFVIAATLAALAGWLQAHYLKVVAPASYSINASLDYLFMTVLGGSSHLVGAVAGPVVFEVMRTMLRDLTPALTGSSGNYELAIFGLIIVLLLQRANGGVIGLIAAWLPRHVPASRAGASPLEQHRLPPEVGTLLLDVQAVTKRFGGLVAVNDVSFEVHSGKIVGLIGPNGAGKSTLFNVITGVSTASEGVIRLGTTEIQNLSSRCIAKKGIARTFQHVQLRPHMSALENVALGAHARAKAGMLASVLRLDRSEEQQILAEAHLQLERVGLAAYAEAEAGSLALGQQRLLEVARALAADPVLLLLDEPAAGLRHQEKQALAALLKELRASGMAILIVEHDMNFVMDVADRLVVLEFGTKLAEGTSDEIQTDPRVIEAYLGPGD